MIKETITDKQGIRTMIQFIIGSAIVIAPARAAKQNTWLALIIAIIFSIAITSVYSKLLTLYSGKNIFDIMQIIFGKILGKIMNVLFIWYSFDLGTLVIRNFSEFIQVVSLPETPQYAIALSIGIFCIFIVKSGLEVLVRWASFMTPLIIGTMLLITILSIPIMDIDNLKPVLYEGIKPVLIGSYTVFTFPFAETVVFTTVFSSLKAKKDVFKVYYKGIILGGVMLIIISTRNNLVLGTEYNSTLYFPTYTSVSVLDMTEFFQRFEIIVALNFLLVGIVKISICLYSACIGLTKLFNIDDYKTIAAPIGLLMITLSLFIYNNLMEMIEWAINVYPYYAFLFQIIIPITLLLGALIKLKLTKPSNINS